MQGILRGTPSFDGFGCNWQRIGNALPNLQTKLRDVLDPEPGSSGAYVNHGQLELLLRTCAGRSAFMGSAAGIEFWPTTASEPGMNRQNARAGHYRGPLFSTRVSASPETAALDGANVVGDPFTVWIASPRQR